MKAQRRLDSCSINNPGDTAATGEFPGCKGLASVPEHCSSDIRAFINSICFKRSTDMLSARCINV